MSARLAPFALTPALEKPPFGVIGGGLLRVWKCQFPGCSASGVSTSRLKKYCDAHAKARNVQRARLAQQKARSRNKA